jgi:hypothetical protein
MSSYDAAWAADGNATGGISHGLLKRFVSVTSDSHWRKHDRFSHDHQYESPRIIIILRDCSKLFPRIFFHVHFQLSITVKFSTAQFASVHVLCILLLEPYRSVGGHGDTDLSKGYDVVLGICCELTLLSHELDDRGSIFINISLPCPDRPWGLPTSLPFSRRSVKLNTCLRPVPGLWPYNEVLSSIEYLFVTVSEQLCCLHICCEFFLQLLRQDVLPTKVRWRNR